jgi:uncharacterized low-complexity protein
MSHKTITPAAAIVGAALVGSLSAINVASAADNPFALKALDSGYIQLAGAESDKGTGEGKCGEGKCGGKTGGEGKCGGKTGGEGKCGEGKCGSKTGGEDKGGAS